VSVIMNNAGTGLGGGTWEKYDEWKRVLDVNLWGVINGIHAFAPAMIAQGMVQGRAGAIVNTGSKQGITTPPGDAAYNLTKAGVKVATEQLAHELRSIAGCGVSAHLLVPGFTFTPMTRPGETAKPEAAWTADQVVEFMLAGMARGDFYILCPDNATTRTMDERRMAWAMGDLIENRPALSRWHPDYKDAFEAFMRGPGRA
jgi:NAD(P)-dependent dehydrogenase (short-subunit alcohol dehydrogenase family)